MRKKYFSGFSVKTFTLICVTLQSFAPLPAAYAQTKAIVTREQLLEIIPGDVAVLQDFHPAEDSTKPFVFYIQDIHASPQTQLKIKLLLEKVSGHFRKPDAPFLIGLEGAHGPLRPEYLDLFKNYPDWNDEAVNNLFSMGELTGAELFAWEEHKSKKGSPRVYFQGMEDPALYRENFRDYREVFFAREENNRLLSLMQAELDRAKSRILSPRLQEFLREKSRRKDGDYKTGFDAPQLYSFIQYLSSRSLRELDLNLKDPVEQLRFPNLVRLISLMEAPAPEALNAAELHALKKLLIASGPEEQAKKINKIFLQLSQAPRRLEFEELLSLATRHRVNLAAHRDFFESAGFKVLENELDAQQVFREMEVIEKALLKKWAPTSRQRKFLKILARFESLEKTLQLRLTRQELRQADLSKTMPSQLVKTLALLEPGKNTKVVLSKPDLLKLDVFFQKSMRFYELAGRRDYVLAGNLLNAIPESSPAAALVSGGFHSDGIISELRRRGAGFAVLRPSVFSEDTELISQRVFRDANAALPQEFKRLDFDKQEALLFNQILQAAGAHWKKTSRTQDQADIERAFSSSLENHPVLSRGLQLSSAPINAQTIVYPLLTSERYSELWTAPAKTAPAVPTPFGDFFSRVGASYRIEAYESAGSRAELRSSTQSILNEQAYQELSAYQETLGVNLGLDNPQTLEKLQKLYHQMEEGNQAYEVLLEYLDSSDERIRNLIQEMLYAYLFAAPAYANRHQSARWILTKIFEKRLNIPAFTEPLITRYKMLVRSNHLSANALAFLIEDVMAEFPNSFVSVAMADFLKQHEPALPKTDNVDIDQRISFVGMDDAALSLAAILAARRYHVDAMGHPRLVASTRKQLQNKDYEPGIRSAYETAIESGRLRMFWQTDQSIAAAVAHSGIIYFDLPLDVSQQELAALAVKIGHALRQARDDRHRIFVFRGTFSVGTTQQLKDLISQAKGDDSSFSVVYHLDAARGGSMIDDERNNQVVLGISDLSQKKLILESNLKPLLRALLEEDNVDNISPDKLQVTSFAGAELAKHALLVNMAAKQSAVNEFARTVVKEGGSLLDVGLIAGLDHRIGSSFTRPKMAMGGQLLEQIRFLYNDYYRRLLESKKYPQGELPDLRNVRDILERFREQLKKPHLSYSPLKDPDYLMTLFLAGILADQERSLKGFQESVVSLLGLTPRGKDRSVAILGVAYKEGTQKITESPGVKFFEWLVKERGVRNFKIYDPLALEEFQNWLLLKKRMEPLTYGSVTVVYETNDPRSILENNDFVLVAAPLKELQNIPPVELKKYLKDTLLVDGVNIYSLPGTTDTPYTLQDVEAAGINYRAYGTPAFGPLLTGPNLSGETYRPKGRLIPSTQKTGPEQFQPIDIAVFGAGYVGAVSGTALAEAGHRVSVIDVNETNVASWNSGQPTFKEPGLKELLVKNLENKNLKFVLGDPGKAKSREQAKVTPAVEEAVRKSRLLYVAVNTPEGEGGKADLIYIETVTRQIGLILSRIPEEERRDAVKVIVVKSTVPGTVFKHIAGILEREFNLVEGLDFYTASNPEILVEGAAVKGAMEPSRTFFGIKTARNGQGTREKEDEILKLLEAAWAPLRNRQATPHPIVETDQISSTAGKYLANSLLYISVSLANTFGQIAKQKGVDYRAEVEPVLRSHPYFTRFGHYKCGPGAGGHCFAKDSREVYYSTRALFGPDKPVAMVETADLVNEIVRRRVAYDVGKTLVRNLIDGEEPLKEKTVGILGLAFKEDTTDVRESPSVVSAIEFALMGSRVLLYDTNFAKADYAEALRKNYKEEFARLFIHDYKGYQFTGRFSALGIINKDSRDEIIRFFFDGEEPLVRFEMSGPEALFLETDALVLFSNEPVYRELDYSMMSRNSRKPLFFDTRGIMTVDVLVRNGIEKVMDVGRPDLVGRAELRTSSTSRFVLDLQKTAPSGVFAPPSRAGLIDLAVEFIPGNVYSLSGISEDYRKELNLNRRDADVYAFQFISGRVVPADGLPEFTQDEEAALGADIIARFFTPSQDGSGGKFVLAENLKSLPALDQSMKLWLRHLSARKNLFWRVDLDGVSKREAAGFLRDLLEKARQWGLPLSKSQIILQASGVSGFDSEFFRSAKRTEKTGYIAGLTDDFKMMPMRGDTVFAATVSADPLRRQAERLLAAEYLLQGYEGPSYQLTSVAKMAGSSMIGQIASALAAYLSIGRSA